MRSTIQSSSPESKSLIHPCSYVSRISPRPLTKASRSSTPTARPAIACKALIRSATAEVAVNAAWTLIPASGLEPVKRLWGKLSRMGSRKLVSNLENVQSVSNRFSPQSAEKVYVLCKVYVDDGVFVTQASNFAIIRTFVA